MNNEDLAKDALLAVCDMSFPCYLYASVGGICGGGWDGEGELELTAGQLLYLISQRLGGKQMFDGFDLEEIDLEKEISQRAFEGAFPEGGPYALVESVVPDELDGLKELLENYDGNDGDAADEIMEQLNDLTDGYYTFHFTIMDAEAGCEIEENVEETIHLTASEVRGLLYNEYDFEDLFQDTDYEVADEDLINEKAEETGITDSYKDYIFGGDCDELETYLDSWETLVQKIADDEVDEDSLGDWIEYFEDSENFSYDIEFWYEDRRN